MQLRSGSKKGTDPNGHNESSKGSKTSTNASTSISKVSKEVNIKRKGNQQRLEAESQNLPCHIGALEKDREYSYAGYSIFSKGNTVKILNKPIVKKHNDEVLNDKTSQKRKHQKHQPDEEMLVIKEIPDKTKDEYKQMFSLKQEYFRYIQKKDSASSLRLENTSDYRLLSFYDIKDHKCFYPKKINTRIEFHRNVAFSCKICQLNNQNKTYTWRSLGENKRTLFKHLEQHNINGDTEVPLYSSIFGSIELIKAAQPKEFRRLKSLGLAEHQIIFYIVLSHIYGDTNNNLDNFEYYQNEFKKFMKETADQDMKEVHEIHAESIVD